MFGISKQKYFRFIAFLVMIMTFLPVFYNNLPRYIGSYHLIAITWLVSILFFSPKLYIQKHFLYLVFYAGVFVALFLNTLWINIEEWFKIFIYRELYQLVVAISIILYFRMTNDYVGLGKITKWAVIFIGITAIMSIYSASINPLYARIAVGDNWNTDAEKYFFERLGGGEYSFASALVGLFPLMFYYYRNNSKSLFSRKAIVIYGLICFFALLRMQIFANILVSAIIIILSFLGRKKIKQSLVVTSLILLVFLLIPKSFYADLLIGASTYFDSSSEIHFKLVDMAKFINLGEYSGTAAGTRASRYPLLFEGFIKNPVFGYSVGNNVTKIVEGGHLYWMSRLAVWGVVGFIPFILIHVYYIKSAIKYFNDEYTFYFLLSVFSIIGLGFLKNLAGRELWLLYFIILPGLYYLPLLKKKKKNSNPN